MSIKNDFKHDCCKEVEAMNCDADLRKLSLGWMSYPGNRKYSYHFSWLGRPVIQYPQDLVAMHEIIWNVKPDLIIETGIAHGGSLIFSASMLALNELCGGPGGATVLGVDIDIRAHNKSAIESHPLASRITMIQGSSIDNDVIDKVYKHAMKYKNIMVCLDSNHTYSHVRDELNAYAKLVSVGSYCVVFDTIIEDMPEDYYPERPWGKGDNPKTAVMEFIQDHPEFNNDKEIDGKLQISVAPGGYLRRLS